MINLQIIVWILSGTILFLLLILFYKIITSRKKEEKPLKATTYKCMDGHVVKSRGEVMIDNLLTKLGLDHIYEDTIRVRGKPIKYDFYLKDHDIYIEYWGLFDREYLKRKKEKINLYNKKKLKLVSIEDIDLKNIYKTLPEKLSKFIDVKSLTNVKHCPNCGKKLDTRFSS